MRGRDAELSMCSGSAFLWCEVIARMCLCTFRSKEKAEFENTIHVKLKEVMMMVDLDEVTSKTVRDELRV